MCVCVPLKDQKRNAVLVVFVSDAVLSSLQKTKATRSGVMEKEMLFSPSAVLRLAFVGLEGNLKHAIAQRVAIQRLNGDQCLVVVRHRHEAKSFAFIGL